MSSVLVDQQMHGYKGGHHLLAWSVRLSREDQDLIDRLSDLSGPLDPGQTFAPYLTTYPLPSGEYYVIARTWQDRQAQRAGCVLTRSLIFSMVDWLERPAVVEALTALKPFQKDEATAERLELLHSGEAIEAVTGSWTDEITEALFLEVRQPIVVFGIKNPDPTLARILTSLWPGLRRQFSTCGFALGPRRLAGRPFDLLCAPATSRVRFSDWAGRKVEVRTESIPRHRWTTAMADQIFRASSPTLGKFDTLGLLRADLKGSEGVLRVALLWNELMEKVDSSPTAALGLLDILRSQDAHVAFDLVEPALKKSILISEEQNDVFEHLRLLLTMLGKFSEQPVPLSLLRLIYESARRLATLNLMDAFTFCSSADSLGRVMPRILCGALAAAAAGRLHQVLGQFVLLLPQTRLRLLASNPEFAWEIAAFVKPTGTGLAQEIKSALEFPDKEMRERAAKHLLPTLSRSEQAPIVSGCLLEASWPAIAKVVALLWRGCHLSVPAFDQPLLSAASAINAIASLRTNVASLPQTTDTDRLLFATLSGRLEDIFWLAETAELSNERRVGMLAKLVCNSSDEELVLVSQSPELKARVLSSLLPLKVAAAQLARIFVVSGISGPSEFDQASALLTDLARSDLQHQLALAMLRSLLFTDFGRAWSVERAAKALATCSPYLSPADVIVGTTDRQLESADLNRNIQVLNATPDAFRVQLLRDIDNLSERIIAFRHSYFDRETIEAWTNLISDAGHIASRAQERAADLVLPFAMKMKYGPATPLIIATFPIVHGDLTEGVAAPNIFTMFFPMGYWDRCDTLRRELVDAFGSSEWPPADLMVVANAANQLKAVSELAFRRLDKKYRKAILKDAARLPKELQESIRRTFAALSREKP